MKISFEISDNETKAILDAFISSERMGHCNAAGIRRHDEYMEQVKNGNDPSLAAQITKLRGSVKSIQAVLADLKKVGEDDEKNEKAIFLDFIKERCEGPIEIDLK